MARADVPGLEGLMGDGVQVVLEGAEVTAQALKDLGEPFAIKAMGSALRAAANVVKKEAKSRAPAGGGGRYRFPYRGKDKTPGTLRQAIVATARREQDGSITLLVGVTSGRRAKHDAFYARFLELGTSKSPPRPFLGPSLDASAGAAVDRARVILGRRIDRACKG